jgi:ribosomal protein S4
MIKFTKRHKPFYKQFLRLKQDIQNKSKLLRFKKQKWKIFQDNLKRQLTPHKRFKMKDQFQLSVSKFAGRGNSFKRKIRNKINQRKMFRLFYGGIKSYYLKKSILKCNKTKNCGLEDYRHNIIKYFESRLDTVLCRVNFSLNIKTASQLILHGHIHVNSKPVKNKSYSLKPNDLIEVANNRKSRALIKNNLNKSDFWPLPPKHLLVNYSTLQILFVYQKDSNLMPLFSNYLDLDSVITNFR